MPARGAHSTAKSIASEHSPTIRHLCQNIALIFLLRALCLALQIWMPLMPDAADSECILYVTVLFYLVRLEKKTAIGE